MGNELTVQTREEREMTVAEIKSGVNLIQQVMRDVMHKGTHYGTIPGCGEKPTLLKPGAEKIMAAFRLVCSPRVEDMCELPERARYRVLADILTSDGRLVGSGVGECSSDEDKYRWRSAVGGEFDETPEDRRREKWKNGRPPYTIKQVRSNPADQANTILKMAKKRALVDGVLTATAASDIFTQDIEELPSEYIDHSAPEPPQKPEPARYITQEQRKRLISVFCEAGYSDADAKTLLKDLCGIDSTAKILVRDYETICAKISQSILSTKAAEKATAGKIVGDPREDSELWAAYIAAEDVLDLAGLYELIAEMASDRTAVIAALGEMAKR